MFTVTSKRHGLSLTKKDWEAVRVGHNISKVAREAGWGVTQLQRIQAIKSGHKAEAVTTVPPLPQPWSLWGLQQDHWPFFETLVSNLKYRAVCPILVSQLQRRPGKQVEATFNCYSGKAARWDSWDRKFSKCRSQIPDAGQANSDKCLLQSVSRLKLPENILRWACHQHL